MQNRHNRYGFVTIGLLMTAYHGVQGSAALARDLKVIGQIPAEYESTSGHGLAMNNGGFATNDGASAIRANPALLALQKQYTLTAGYHWPESGRNYYQAAVVDSQTSSIAAGVSYTGFMDEHQYYRESSEASPFDSPLLRRGVLGVAQNFGRLALGVGATYIESRPVWSAKLLELGQDKAQRGVGLNIGASSPLTPELQVGASVENISNPKIKEYAPRTFRAGLAYSFTKMVIGFLDLRQRDRVDAFEAREKILLDTPPTEEAPLPPERMALVSFSAHIQDLVRLVGSYGQSLTDDRRSLAGGLAIVNKQFSLSYTVARPYMKLTTAHQAVTLSMDMAM